MKNPLVLILALVAQYSFAQILNPVKWELSVVPVEPLEYELVFTANIEKIGPFTLNFLRKADHCLPLFLLKHHRSMKRLGLLMKSHSIK